MTDGLKTGLVGGAISAGANIGSQIFNNIFNKRAARKQKRHGRKMARHQFDLNMQMAEYQHNKNLELWDLQNQYNHPASQMARLKEAGINPHLYYAKGQGQNTASSIAPYQSAKADFSGVPSGAYAPQIDVPSALNAYSDFRTKKATADYWEQKVETESTLGELNLIKGLDVQAATRKKDQELQNLANLGVISGYQAKDAEAKWNAITPKNRKAGYQAEWQKTIAMAGIQEEKLHQEQLASAMARRVKRFQDYGLSMNDDVMLRMGVLKLLESGYSYEKVLDTLLVGNATIPVIKAFGNTFGRGISRGFGKALGKISQGASKGISGVFKFNRGKAPVGFNYQGSTRRTW